MSHEVGIKVLLFARLRELFGAAEVPVTVSAGCTLEELILALAAGQPNADGLVAALSAPNVRLAHNEALVAEALPTLAEGDRIAFLPPVTGG